MLRIEYHKFIVDYSHASTVQRSEVKSFLLESFDKDSLINWSEFCKLIEFFTDKGYEFYVKPYTRRSSIVTFTKS